MRIGVGAAHAALVVGGAVTALLVVEGLLRLCPALAGPLSTPAEKIYFARYDPELGWAPRPLVAGRHRDDGVWVFVSQNAWGLRAAADVGPARRIAGRRRILVLGDSYVWGYGASQHELFTDPAVAGDGIDLVNFGVSGYGTDQELLFYRRLGTRFDVDEVALVFTPYNDVENNLEPEQYGYRKPYFTLAADGGLTLHREHLHESRVDEAAEALLVDSRAINLLIGGSLRVRNVLLRDFEAPLGAAEARDRLLGPGDVTARDRAGLALTMALIRTLGDEVRAHGAGFSVVFVPYKPHIVAGAPENHPFVPLLASALFAAHIPYYEPYWLFLEASRGGPPLFNALDNHFSAAGHRVFARVFADPAVRAATRDLYQRRAALRSPGREWSHVDSNHGPPACEAANRRRNGAAPSARTPCSPRNSSGSACSPRLGTDHPVSGSLVPQRYLESKEIAMRVTLTARSLPKLAAPTSGQVDYFDKEVPGFGLPVSADSARSWIVLYRRCPRGLREQRVERLLHERLDRGLPIEREVLERAMRAARDPGRELLHALRPVLLRLPVLAHLVPSPASWAVISHPLIMLA